MDAQQIMIVEDESTLLRGLLRGLSLVSSFQLRGCTTVEEALESLLESIPDLLITDLNFPKSGLSGLDLLDHLQQRNIRIPVIVMTAFRDHYKRELSDLLDLTVVEKPVKLVDLRHLIEKKLASDGGSAGPFQAVDYIQMACLGRHSLVLDLVLEEEGRGTIQIYMGEIWDARLGDLPAFDALQVLLYKPSLHLLCLPLHQAPAERRFERRWDDLLLESARLRDESMRNHHSMEMLSGSFSMLDAIGAWEPEDLDPQSNPSLANIAAHVDAQLHGSHKQTNTRSLPSGTPEAIGPTPQVGGRGSQHPSQALSKEKSIMAKNNIQECLEELTELDGFVGACLADTASGMSLGSIGGGDVNLSVAAASNSEVVKSKRKAIKNLRLKESIEDILITLDSQYHLIRPSNLKEELFFYLVLDRQRSNLALARIALNEVETELRV